MPVATAQPRTLYHSRLRGLGPVAAVLTHKPRPSKFPGKPEYCRFVLDGIEHDYQCETPAIAEQLQAVPLGQPLRIHALGSKEGRAPGGRAGGGGTHGTHVLPRDHIPHGCAESRPGACTGSRGPDVLPWLLGRPGRGGRAGVCGVVCGARPEGAQPGGV